MNMNFDQAANLRKLTERMGKGVDLSFQHVVRNLFPADKPVFVFVGEGAGIISFSALMGNLAVALSRRGTVLACCEAHSHSMSIGRLFARESLPLSAFARGAARLPRVIVDFSERIKLISGFEAVEGINEWDPDKKFLFFQAMEGMCRNTVDMVFVNETDLRFAPVMDHIVIVLSPDDDSVISAYKKVKLIHEMNEDARFYSIVNHVHTPAQGKEVSARFQESVEKFLGVSVRSLGCSLLTPEVLRSIKQRKAYVLSYVYSKSAAHIREIAQNIEHVSSRAKKPKIPWS
ncbi:MAG: hypothetical protein GF333_05080 [Candidatus Omnitrophica bacterium]|nr:hypothetical protein [Candidatus Omnitrophota bacterium]